MKNQDILAYLFIGFILFVMLRLYFDRPEFQLKCIISSVDGEKYCVRERLMLNDAADLLAKVTMRCKEMVVYMKDTHPTDPRVKKLVNGFSETKISETLPTSELTAYSENKGQRMAFCLNKKRSETSKMIDLDTLTFVALHELSHIMTTSYGHKTDFWENFKFLLENAKDAKIYNPVDYQKNPTEYCGMTITSSPYYNM